MMRLQTGTKNRSKKYFCMHCLQNFTTEEILTKHKEKCIITNDTQKSTWKFGTIEFKNDDKEIPIPFKIYADIQFLIKK